MNASALAIGPVWSTLKRDIALLSRFGVWVLEAGLDPASREQIAQAAQEMRGEGDFSLLAFMGDQTDVVFARAAFAEFYNRHAGYLLTVCKGRFRAHGSAWCEDLVQDAVMRAYDRASSLVVSQLVV